MSQVFRKEFNNVPYKTICNEVELQTRAAYAGFAPMILATDKKTYIEMENLDEMCIADMYGEDIDAIPNYIIEEIYVILERLYTQYDIEYIDVTPYNFIEYAGKTWIIDFGHAKPKNIEEPNWYLKKILEDKKVSFWNPDFR